MTRIQDRVSKLDINPLVHWTNTAARLRTGWRPLVVFDVLCKVLSYAVVAPLFSWFLAAMLTGSGSSAISNFEILSFVLSAPGLVFVTVAATGGFAVVFLEIGGLTMIALTLSRGERTSALATLNFLARNFHRLCTLAFIQFVSIAAIISAALAVAALTASLVLSGGDFYYYLRVMPPQFFVFAAVSGLAFLIAIVAVALLAVRWVYSVPMLLIEGKTARQALAESAELSRTTGRWAIAFQILVTIVAVVLIYGLSTVLHGAIDWVLVRVAADAINLLVVLTGLSLVVGLVLGTVASFVASLIFAGLLADLFTEARPDFDVPAAMVSDNRRATNPALMRQRTVVVLGVIALAIGATIVTRWLTDQIDLDREVAITAHRGASKAAPENTMAALRAAIRFGADYAEIDVQRTKDGVVVLLHDKDFRRVAGSSANIWDLTLEEVRKLDVGSWFSEEFAGEPVPTLAEAIDATKGKIRLNIEMKVNGHDDGLAAGVARVLAETECGQDCVVSSLDYAVTREIAPIAPDLRRGLIVTASLGDVSRLDVDFLAVNAGTVTRDLVGRAQDIGKEVHVWTVNDPDQMLSMYHMGVDNILTSTPDVLADLLSLRAGLSDAEKVVLLLADLVPARRLVRPDDPDASRP